jgi:hypothetical protein
MTREMTTDEAIITLKQAVDETFGAGIEIITRGGCEAVKMAIEALQERKTGKWIEQAVHNTYADYRCSECGRTETIYYAFGYIPTQERVVEKFPYCHCGAKMEVEECGE